MHKAYICPGQSKTVPGALAQIVSDFILEINLAYHIFNIIKL